jgi:hypothetical protein
MTPVSAVGNAAAGLFLPHHRGAGGNAMNTVNNARSTLDKYAPLLVGLLAAWLAGKALKRTFWSMFGMYWALRAAGIHLF